MASFAMLCEKQGLKTEEQSVASYSAMHEEGG